MSPRLVIASALALLLHGLLLQMLPAASDQRANAAQVSNAPLVREELVIVPIAIDFLAGPVSGAEPAPLEPPAGNALRVDRSAKHRDQERERKSGSDRESVAGPKDRTPSEAPGTGDPSSSLRMRSGQIPSVDALEGSRLSAAIFGAPLPPYPSERGDLLSIPTTSTERHQWRPAGQGTLRAEGEPFKAEIAADGRIEFSDRRNVQLEGVSTMPGTWIPAIGGRFDLTDAVMSSLGETLYPYRKLKLMDDSREMRSQMALTYREDALREALKSYRGRLAKLWSSKTYSVPERKRLFFALWDECAERGPDSVVSAAQSIRATTLAFIRRRLPPHHPSAYSESELRELNATRQSSATFAPYDEHSQL